jgi:hypothetical protein
MVERFARILPVDLTAPAFILPPVVQSHMSNWRRDSPGSDSNYRRIGSFSAREDGSQTLIIYARDNHEAWIQSDTFVSPVDAPSQPAEDA